MMICQLYSGTYMYNLRAAWLGLEVKKFFIEETNLKTVV